MENNEKAFALQMEVRNTVSDLVESLQNFSSLPEMVEALNYARSELHNISPFKDNPVDFVEWVPASIIRANDYNPNQVAVS